jgi:hypothetical protein
MESLSDAWAVSILFKLYLLDAIVGRYPVRLLASKFKTPFAGADANDFVKGILNDHAVDLHDRFENGGSITDLEQSISLLQYVVNAIPEDEIGAPLYLSNLGVFMVTRYE